MGLAALGEEVSFDVVAVAVVVADLFSEAAGSLASCLVSGITGVSISNLVIAVGGAGTCIALAGNGRVDFCGRDAKKK